MGNLLKVSPSPHIHSGNSIKKEMYGVLLALIPTFLASFYFFGIDALILSVTAVVAAVVVEFLIQKFILKGELTILDGSAVITGLLLAFNLPSNLPIWILLIGVVIAIGVAKMSFGGLGQNPFNPALVGRVFLLISFPVDMTTWPTTIMDKSDAITGATPLALVKEGFKNGENWSDLLLQIPSSLDLFQGQMGGSLGEVSAIAIIIGGIFLLWRKIITWHIPLAILGSMFVFSGILHWISPEEYATPLFHLLTGGVLLGALFMATDMATSPMTSRGGIVFGVGIGVITIVIRVFGAYPEGVSFAILLMNSVVPLINQRFKPKRFGEKVKSQ